MADEKKEKIARDPNKMLLEEALARHRDEMMDNFAHILKQISMSMKAPSTSNNFKCTTPFKVQTNFEIPLFEGRIDADALGKWLSLLKGLTLFKKNSTMKRPPSRPLSPFPCQRLLSPFPMSKISWTLTMCNRPKMNLKHLG